MIEFYCNWRGKRLYTYPVHLKKEAKAFAKKYGAKLGPKQPGTLVTWFIKLA